MEGRGKREDDGGKRRRNVPALSQIVQIRRRFEKVDKTHSKGDLDTLHPTSYGRHSHLCLGAARWRPLLDVVDADGGVPWWGICGSQSFHRRFAFLAVFAAVWLIAVGAWRSACRHQQNNTSDGADYIQMTTENIYRGPCY